MVEKIGVEKSLELIKKADLIIYVIDNTSKNIEQDLKQLETITNKNTIVFINKDDVKSELKLSQLSDFNLIFGNTINPEGLDQLKNEIINLFNLEKLDKLDFSYLSSARQISLVKKSLEIINSAILGLSNGIPVDLITVDLRNSYDVLGEIIGETYKDDLLDELFSKFCLGK